MNKHSDRNDRAEVVLRDHRCPWLFYRIVTFHLNPHISIEPNSASCFLPDGNAVKPGRSLEFLVES